MPHFLLAAQCMMLALFTREGAAAQMTRGPYLQKGTTTSVTIRWRTDEPTDSRVRFGNHPSNLNRSAVSEAGTTEHEIPLASLLPDTTYYYSVGNSNQTFAAGTNYFFVTAPRNAKPTRIWVIGDAGTHLAGQLAVRDAYYAFTGNRHTDIWLMLGDNAYGSGTDFEYQGAVFETYHEMLRKSVVWPTMGNHDTYSSGEAEEFPYLEIFSLPTAGEAGGFPSGTEKYYSFDYGNIHFVVLDSMSSDRSIEGPMCTWLQQDLASTTNQWLIAYWHHPPYSKGSHDSDFEFELVQMRQNVLPILEAYGVDLILCGHSHSYERSFLLHGHYGSSGTLMPEMILDAGSGRETESGAYEKGTNSMGAVYVVAGSSGWTGHGAFNHPAMYTWANELGSLVLDIDGPRLDAVFLRENGVVQDNFSILKPGAVPATRITSFFVNAGIMSITWRAEAGRTYYVQRTRSIDAPEWETISPPITAAGETATWATLIEPDPNLFFRVSSFGD
jgi:acid phosphatase type 7